jgi:chromosome segregation ATPase
MREKTKRFKVLMVLMVSGLVLVFSGGCRSTYDAMWESLGKEKRHLLRDEVEQAREDQAEASEDFKDALTRVKELTDFQGGELENVYRQLKDDYDDCEQRAAIIDERIANVEQIAADLFAEWETEIGQMTNATFRASSRRSLARTRERYDQLQRAMVRARERMDPVLSRLKDYVLYLKHNLNAQAVGALGAEMGHIEADVDVLIRDIERSIQAADTFLKDFDAS